MTTKKKSATVLRVPAIEVTQGPRRRLYSFALDGKQIDSFATISRIHRDPDEGVQGYQRPEVVSHIAQIREYIESENPMIPNAIVIAFDKRVRFEPSTNGVEHNAYTRPGTLVIPVDPTVEDEKKPGWVVDGQQRLAAVREASIRRFPMCITAFIAPSDKEQREQFILVNSTKPLPKGLIYELLPGTEARLPGLLQKRRFPSYLLNRLNQDADSPLRQRIRTPTMDEGIIKDNSVLKMLENSLSDGALYRFRDARTGTGDIEAMLSMLKNFWSAAAEVFADAWELPPKRSRLTHGAGFVSLGFVMDAIADRHGRKGVPQRKQFHADLEPLVDVCRWTDGYWDFGPGVQRRWNEVQNTTKDIQMLANYLLIEYKARVWNHARVNKMSAEPARRGGRARASA